MECKIEEKTYRFTCEMDASILHVKEALFQFQKYVGQIEDAAKAQQEASAEECKKDLATEQV